MTKSAKLFPFFILTDQEKFFQTFPGWKMIKLFPIFSRLRRNPACVKHILHKTQYIMKNIVKHASSSLKQDFHKFKIFF